MFATCASSVGGRSRDPGFAPPMMLEMTMLPMRLAFGTGFSWRSRDPLMLWRFAMACPSLRRARQSGLQRRTDETKIVQPPVKVFTAGRRRARHDAPHIPAAPGGLAGG